MKQVGINEKTFDLPLEEFLRLHKNIRNDVDLVAEWNNRNESKQLPRLEGHSASKGIAIVEEKGNEAIVTPIKTATDGKDNTAAPAKKAGKAGRRANDTNSDREHSAGDSETATSADAGGEKI